MTEPILPPGPIAPLPPNVAKEPLGKCMPDAQNALDEKSINVVVFVAMSLLKYEKEGVREEASYGDDGRRAHALHRRPGRVTIDRLRVILRLVHDVNFFLITEEHLRVREVTGDAFSLAPRGGGHQ